MTMSLDGGNTDKIPIFCFLSMKTYKRFVMIPVSQF